MLCYLHRVFALSLLNQLSPSTFRISCSCFVAKDRSSACTIYEHGTSSRQQSIQFQNQKTNIWHKTVRITTDLLGRAHAVNHCSKLC